MSDFCSKCGAPIHTVPLKDGGIKIVGTCNVCIKCGYIEGVISDERAREYVGMHNLESNIFYDKELREVKKWEFSGDIVLRAAKDTHED